MIRTKKRILNTMAVVACYIGIGCQGIACQSAGSFNDLAISEENRTGDVIPLIDLKQGSTVADLGAGGGYYTVKLARGVGEKGKVYAVDISAESVNYIKEYSKKEGVSNVEAILADMDNSKLPEKSMDMVFVRNAFHDIQNRVVYFNKLKSVLKPDGRVVIIDYDPQKLGFFRKLAGHFIEEEMIVEEMKKAGYVVSKQITVLKEQSCNIFIIEETL